MSARKQTIESLRKAIATGLVGQTNLVDGLLRALLANGHVLIEGVPGLAKTRAVRLLAQACGGQFKRIQFTPDLLPADIVGTRIFDRTSGDFQTKTGPVFANFVLADEINRAAPKVQSALLEAMQERQVTIGDHTHELPSPFLVFATQNPVEQRGTYPLPEAQVDRFLCKLVVGYPENQEEAAIVEMVMNETDLPPVETVLDADALRQLQGEVRDMYVDGKLVQYATQIVRATREPAAVGDRFAQAIELGASPRASIALVQMARAEAILNNRGHAYPEDVKKVAVDVLRHRIQLSYHAEAEGITAIDFITAILDTVKVP